MVNAPKIGTVIKGNYTEEVKRMGKILVIGSYNVGLWVMGPRIPKIGETIMGNNFVMGPGGKGSNQAITVARLGGGCRLPRQNRWGHLRAGCYGPLQR